MSRDTKVLLSLAQLNFAEVSFKKYMVSFLIGF